MSVDPARLKASWARVLSFGTPVPGFFYARLFLTYPQLRELFPASMSAQQDRLFAALGRIVTGIDDVASALSFAQQLGRDHRKFTVRPEHYPMVGEALLATLEVFLAEEWTPDLAADWATAYRLVSEAMIDAAAVADSHSPPWWEAEVLAHERRGLDVAVLRILPRAPYVYQPGQSLSVQTALRPRVWRFYSPANAPRDDGTIDLHVKAVPGGHVSGALVNGVEVGDVLTLGPPIGTGLTLDPLSGRDLLLLAGGTGLAPLKALVEQIGAGGGRRISLVVGARTAVDLYDLPSLNGLATALPWLTVVPAVSHDPWHEAEHGTAVDVALRLGWWHDRDVYVCGSNEMVTATVERLRQVGIPAEQIRVEDYDSDPYRPQSGEFSGHAGDPATSTVEQGGPSPSTARST
jgi:NAD(P)H-flavin reductase/hemoglobin-like flavoprotein